MFVLSAYRAAVVADVNIDCFPDVLIDFSAVAAW